MQKTSDIIWQDTQHQSLFEILDLIKEPGADANILLRLQAYTENHFGLEEEYMRLLNYPGRDEHIRAHDIFRKEICQIFQEDQPPDAVFMEMISTFLTEWLTRHIFGIDKKLEAFILQSPAK